MNLGGNAKVVKVTEEMLSISEKDFITNLESIRCHEKGLRETYKYLMDQIDQMQCAESFKDIASGLLVDYMDTLTLPPLKWWGS